MSALLPCPFCGSTEVSVSHTVQGSCWVVCETAACGAIGPTKPTPAEAASAWNTRALSVGGAVGAARPEDTPALGLPEVVLPVEMESRLVGDMAGFRAREVELREERDPTRRSHPGASLWHHHRRLCVGLCQASPPTEVRRLFPRAYPENLVRRRRRRGKNKGRSSLRETSDPSERTSWAC